MIFDLNCYLQLGIRSH